jgi:DNA-binding winged helix-turn-helix (wHTH) protein
MIARFGAFELDVDSGELRKNGLRVRLAGQPLEILRALIARPGDVVTRDELRNRLWPADTFVDFDVSLSSAVRKLREALEDSAERPQFVETLPRRGYRFIAPVSMDQPVALAAPAAESIPVPPPARRRSWPAVAGLVTLAIVAAVFWRVGLTTGRSATTSKAVGGRGDVPANVAPAAYDAYLKGVELAGRQTYEGFKGAAGYFEESVARQPDFAAAWARLAQARMQFVYAGPIAPRAAVPAAESAARKALALDDRQALAHRMLGQILHNYYWRWEEGDRELRRARELEGESAEAHAQKSAELIRHGRLRDGVAEAERAKALDPRSLATALGLAGAYRDAQEYEQSLAELDRALAIDPQRPRAHFQRGVTLVFMNHLDDGIASLERATSLSANNPRFEAYLAYVLARRGRTREAREKLADLQARSEKEYVSAFGIALIYDALHDKASTLAALQKAVDDHAVELSQYGQYPAFQTVAGDPRYKALMREVGRVP